jgi:hypothetical protein
MVDLILMFVALCGAMMVGAITAVFIWAAWYLFFGE